MNRQDPLAAICASILKYMYMYSRIMQHVCMQLLGRSTNVIKCLCELSEPDDHACEEARPHLGRGGTCRNASLRHSEACRESPKARVVDDLSSRSLEDGNGPSDGPTRRESGHTPLYKMVKYTYIYKVIWPYVERITVVGAGFAGGTVGAPEAARAGARAGKEGLRVGEDGAGFAGEECCVG